VCWGGRYDDLAGRFAGEPYPGVGGSIGLTRLYWQLRDAGLTDPLPPIDVVVTIMDESGFRPAARLSRTLRAAGLRTEVASRPGRLGKQLKRAARLGAPFVCIQGEDERRRGVVSVKDLRSGDQTELSMTDVPAHIRRALEDI